MREGIMEMCGNNEKEKIEEGRRKGTEYKKKTKSETEFKMQNSKQPTSWKT